MDTDEPGAAGTVTSDFGVRGLVLTVTHKSGSGIPESQRDSVIQPRAARLALPWVRPPDHLNTNGVAFFAPPLTQPRWDWPKNRADFYP